MLLQHALRTVQRPTVTFIGTTANITNASTYTFNSVNIGGPGLIVIAVHGSETGGGLRQLTSLTVNGNNATIHSNIASADFAFLTSYRVTSGTTANIVVTFLGNPGGTSGANVARCLIAVYRIQFNSSDTPVQALGSYTGTTGSTTRVLNFTSAANAVGVFGISSSSGTATFTWTNATEQFDTIVEANTATSGAVRNLSAATVDVTGTCTVSSRLYLSGGLWA